MVAMIKNKLNAFFAKIVPHRLWVQLSFLLAWLDPFGWRLHYFCAPVFHCHSCPLALFACPIGVIANFTALHLFPFIAVGVIVIVGIFLGSIICGWVCPFGLLQDLAAKIPTRKFDLPKWTGAFRYVVLIGAVLAIPFFFGSKHPLFICSFCPAGAIEAGAPNMVSQATSGQTVIWPNALKLSVLGLLLIAVFFVNRPWCRLLCPLGAIFGLFNRISAFFLGFNPDKCTDCQLCKKLCDYGVDPVKNPSDSRCIRCFECTRCSPGALFVGSIFSRSDKTA
jgi:polyferredoxin